MTIIFSEESGEWRATFESAPQENNGVSVKQTITVSLSAANAEQDWRKALAAIMDYASINS
ncbi:MAG: hypothetical protein KGL39_46595 [Patescibacteria group bacterium]|nr:hypothetical protein [Patescibacteria group bacterium]